MVWELFLAAFVPLFVIVDPFASMGLFMGLTKGRSDKDRMMIALKAGVFATLILLLFASTGTKFLGLLGIQLYSLRVAGGLLLVMIGLRMLREGREIPRREIREVHLPTGGAQELDEPEGDPSFVPLGIPMLAGPGAISLVIVTSTASGFSIVALAIFATMGLGILILMAAAKMHYVLGDTGSRVITRIMGILTVAFAAQYVLDGIAEWRIATG